MLRLPALSAVALVLLALAMLAFARRDRRRHRLRLVAARGGTPRMRPVALDREDLDEDLVGEAGVVPHVVRGRVVRTQQLARVPVSHPARAVQRAMDVIRTQTPHTQTPHAEARGVGVGAVVTPSTEACRQACAAPEESSPLLCLSTPAMPTPTPAPTLDRFERTCYRDLKGRFRLQHGRDVTLAEGAALHFEARKRGALHRQHGDCAACAAPITESEFDTAELAYPKHARRGSLVHAGACLTKLRLRKLISRLGAASERPKEDA